MLIKPRQLLKLNLKLYMDQIFIRDGNYQNIRRGVEAYDGTDLSKLACSENSKDLNQLGFTTTTGAGKVWQSPFRNWVYMSGLQHAEDRSEVQKANPTLCSGVWINNCFKSQSPNMPWGYANGWDPTCYPIIDWMNGRVIMSSGLDGDTSVQAEYAYSEIMVQIGNRHNANIDEYVRNTKYGTNPDYYGGIHYPSGRFQPMPVVFIQIPRQSHGAYEIGNRSIEETAEVIFHCYSRSMASVDNMLDTIRLQDYRPFPIVDFNVAPIPLSGFIGARSPNYVRYAVLQSNPIVNLDGYSSLYANGHFNSAQVMADTFEDYEYGTVSLDVLVTLIVPDGPIGTSSIGYNFWDQP